jgi:hypothetical protein
MIGGDTFLGFQPQRPLSRYASHIDLVVLVVFVVFVVSFSTTNQMNIGEKDNI